MTRFDPSEFHGSPYAAELQGRQHLRFSAPLEAQFIAEHTERVRFRVQIWWLFGLANSVAFTLRRLPELQPFGFESTVRIAAIFVLAVLTAMSFPRRLGALMYRLSTVSIPIIALTWTMLGSLGWAQGDHDRAVAIGALIVCLFFLSGALLRTALFSCVLIIAVFAVVALLSPTPTPGLITLCFLVLTASLGAFVSWDMEKAYRQNFIELGLISELTERDGLTGVKNRRAFDAHLERAWAQAVREQRLVAVLMIDVDHFKRYNDNNGHQAGDEVLRRVGRLVRSTAKRPLDIAARYGGEEFVVVLYDSTPEHAAEVSEQLRRSIFEGMGDRSSDGINTVSVSIGVAITRPAAHRSSAGLVQLADEALYEAKQAGRNCVRVKSEEYTNVVTGAFNAPGRHVQHTS